MPIPTMTESAERMRHHWDNKRYPTIVYVETTNVCNARCTFCLYDRMERHRETMSLDTFKEVVTKVKQRDGLKIGAMFCFGDPLADRGLFDKIRYARAQGVLTNYLGLNTNVSMLTPSRYDDLLATCSNLTLSFPHAGEKFERMTGLSWELCYKNAIDFIQYRDANKPGFKIEIGCNDVTGHNRGDVKKAFDGYNVAWARDAEIRWGDRVITGVIDRSIMYHKWSCDGHKGALQVKPNGDLALCAYDVIRNETVYANILRDDWGTIEREFKRMWTGPSTLCVRCDFWWNYFQMVDNGWKRGPHISNEWQDVYNPETMKTFWSEKHSHQEVRFLTGSRLSRVAKYLQFVPVGHVLNIGVGTGQCTSDLANNPKVSAVDALDISQESLERVAPNCAATYDDPKLLKTNEYDFAMCHLVVQHMTSVDVTNLLIEVMRSLKDNAMLAIQYASPVEPEAYEENVDRAYFGTIRRSQELFERIVRMSGGKIIKDIPELRFSRGTLDGNAWRGAHVVRDSYVKSIGGTLEQVDWV